MLHSCTYEMIDDAGLHIQHDGNRQLLDVDSVIICAGQEAFRELYDELTVAGFKPILIGGADVASELDAKRAIDQGVRIGVKL